MHTLFESLRAGADILPALFGGLAGKLIHPGIGHDRFVEALHKIPERLAQGILEFPVAKR